MLSFGSETYVCEVGRNELLTFHREVRSTCGNRGKPRDHVQPATFPHCASVCASRVLCPTWGRAAHRAPEHAYERFYPAYQSAWDESRVGPGAYVDYTAPVNVLTGAAGCPENQVRAPPPRPYRARTHTMRLLARPANRESASASCE